jgi:FtsH-binding integral membrane protein
MHQYRISIWFFIGLSLLVNGILICGAAIWELTHPPAQAVVLFRLHAGIWWGALLSVLGLVYMLRFAPKRPTGA